MDTPPWGGGVPSGISGIKRIYTKFSGIKPYGLHHVYTRFVYTINKRWSTQFLRFVLEVRGVMRTGLNSLNQTTK